MRLPAEPASSTRSSRGCGCATSPTRPGRPVTLGRRARRGVGRRRRPRRRRRVADGRVAAQPGRRGDRPRAPGDGRGPARARCPTSPTTTSSARRTASATTSSTTTSAATPGWPRPAPRWRPAASGWSSTSCPTTSRPTTRGRPQHPEWFVRGTADDLAADPDSFLAVGDAVIARGRDPYFPAWPEVLQLDASRPAPRGRRGGRAWRRSPSAATACAATWRCSCSTTSSCARGASGPPAARRPTAGGATGRR